MKVSPFWEQRDLWGSAFLYEALSRGQSVTAIARETRKTAPARGAFRKVLRPSWRNLTTCAKGLQSAIDACK